MARFSGLNYATALIPFESRALARNAEFDMWKPIIFGFYAKGSPTPFYAVGGTCWRYCIPYVGNEHLLGSTGDCDDFYKYWKNNVKIQHLKNG